MINLSDGECGANGWFAQTATTWVKGTFVDGDRKVDNDGLDGTSSPSPARRTRILEVEFVQCRA
jgi:hypothetical protein